MPAPINQGKNWTTRERAELMDMYRFGTSIKLMASELGRSEFAVECQLDSLKKKGLKENTPSTRLLNPCMEIPSPKFCEQEPTEGQLKLVNFLENYDGSVVRIRNIYTKQSYVLTHFNPYKFDGVAEVKTANGRTLDMGFHWVTDNCELIEEEDDMKSRRITWMVSVDGMQAPKEQHLSPESAHEEAMRLAHKNPNKHVRVLRLEDSYIAELSVRKI